MFGKSKIVELEDKVYDLQRDLVRMKDERDNLLSLLEGERAKTRDCECVFDFKHMKAFSVERLWDRDGNAKTVIGYIKPETQEVSEWSLYCNEAQHERLIAEFKKVMK